MALLSKAKAISAPNQRKEGAEKGNVKVLHNYRVKGHSPPKTLLIPIASSEDSQSPIRFNNSLELLLVIIIIIKDSKNSLKTVLLTVMVY